jgi:hypothetical protein
MSSTTLWSWIVTVVGLSGFVLAGRKIWWAWYVNIACQVLWVTFALVSGLYAFLISAAVYTVVFTNNAIRWTKEHQNHKPSIHQQRFSDKIVVLVSGVDPHDLDALVVIDERIFGIGSYEFEAYARDWASEFPEDIVMYAEGAE